jgi:hypothetical protein
METVASTRKSRQDLAIDMYRLSAHRRKMCVCVRLTDQMINSLPLQSEELTALMEMSCSVKSNPHKKI